MPGQPFTVHPDDDDLARQELAAAVPSLPAPERSTGKSAGEHHGARDGRQAARQQSERARSGRASGAGGGRSYAFRRS